MAFSLGAITSKLTMDSSGFTRGILSAQALSQTFGATFATFITNPVLGGIAALTNFGRSAIKAGKDALSMAEAMQLLSDQTGIAVETIRALAAQNRQAGSSAEIAERATRNFATRVGQAELGSLELVKALKQVGVNADNVGKMDDAFKKAVDTISKMESAQQRAAIAAKLFGEEAGPLIIRALRGAGGEIDAVIEKFTKIGKVVDSETNARLTELNTLLGITELGIEGIKQTAVIEFIKGATGEIDLSEEAIVRMAASLRDEIGPAANEFGKTLGELLPLLREFVTLLTQLASSDLAQGVAATIEISSGNNRVTGSGFLDELGRTFNDISAPAQFIRDREEHERQRSRAGQ